LYLCRNTCKRYNYHVFVQIVLSGDKDMNDALVYFLEMIGTVAFAWSGAMVGIRKNLDIFGVIVLGVVTAVGGGVCRDLLLGITPPNMFLNPAYALVAFATALLLFLIAYKKQMLLESKTMLRYERLMNFFDALGLGIFSVVGVNVGYSCGHKSKFFLLFLGVITGIGGGIMRDLLAGELPVILYKRIYAVAAIAGAGICVYLIEIDDYLAAALGAAVVVCIRMLATHYAWNLPKIVQEKK